MTFYNKELPYRVTLDTKTNMFVVYSSANERISATGVTIEQAIRELKKTA